MGWLGAALITAIFAGLYFKAAEPPITRLPDPFEQAFVWEEVVAPKLSGPALKAAALLVSLPIVGPLLVGVLKNDNGVAHVRSLAAALDVTPLYYPLVEPNDSELEQHLRMAASDASRPPLGGRVAALTAAYASRRTTPTHVAAATVAAVEASEQGERPLLALIALDAPSRLMRSAAASTVRWAEGRALGALDGVPFVVKDQVDVEGYATLTGTSFLHRVKQRASNASKDALPVARLRRAGALIVGKAAMHEIGIGTTGHNVHHGTPRNPYSDASYPGGSSSGSAVAVGAGLVPMAIAADGGGSVRIPAALCGGVGLKVTYGRIPTNPSELLGSVGVLGPIGADAASCAAMYLAMAGAVTEAEAAEFDQAEAAPRQPVVHAAGFDRTDDLADVRIGVLSDFSATADASMRQATSAILEGFAARGAKLVNVSLSGLQTAARAHSVTILSEMATEMDLFHSSHLNDFSLDTQIKLSLSRSLSARELLAAQKVRRHMVDQLKQIFASVDVIATPATATPAPPIEPEEAVDLVTTEKLMRFSTLANFAGNPAIVFPVAQTDDGRPLSVMLSAAWWNEHVLLRMAHAAEKLRPPLQPPQRYHGAEIDGLLRAA